MNEPIGHPMQRTAPHIPAVGLTGLVERAVVVMQMIPYGFVAFLGRFSIAAVFWKSGQTKVENFAIDLIGGEFKLGIPRLSDSAVFLFKEEYRLPFLSPEWGATLAALAEHIFPVVLLFGLATRFSALGLLVMTAVIEIFVYPNAYPTHGTWAAVLLFLMVYGPGKFSLDHLFFSRD
jgi:putative oxidoreductase